jgi:hypothetical protein
MLSALGVLLFWVGGSATCRAGGVITGGVDPAYTACLSVGSYCSDVVRTQFRLQYKAVSVRRFSVRVKLLRAYQITMDDDKDDGVTEQERASIFDPPFDVIDVKLRFSAPDGRDNVEVRTGYAYQSSDPNTVDGYHSPYLSGDYYFGAPIPSGWGGLSRRLDVLLRVSQNLYAQASRPPEALDQLVTTYTVPLNTTGSTRMYTSYAREFRFSGSNSVRTPSNRFDLGGYRDPTRWLEFYARLSLFATRGIPGAARFVAGVDITI